MNQEKSRLSERLNTLTNKDIEFIYAAITEIDTAKNSWKITENLQPQTIERLTRSVIVTSTGASNRIEGNKLTDEQVADLYKNIRIKKFKTRDEQEVAGYLKTLELIFTHYQHIPLTESSILTLHKDMLQYSDKDERHRGGYKFSPNRIEAKDQSGNLVGIIFEPTAPHLVKKEIQELIEWYQWAIKTKFKHPLILIANFIFEYLAIHPFQDGNGRTSRLLTNLMLLHQSYQFVIFVSHEKIVETNKIDYYVALNKTQQHWKHAQENVSPWLIFFLNILKQQAHLALKILESDTIEHLLSEKQQLLWGWILEQGNVEFSRKTVIEALNFPERTAEASIKKLLNLKRIKRIGQGKATRYTIVK
jgi:Uncharacterized conserved protein